MFMNPETDPAEPPAISAVTDQKELWDRYKAPAPPANTMLANRTSSARAPDAMKTPAITIEAAARKHRPTRGPRHLVSRSLIVPPRRQQTSIARNGNME